MKMSKTAVLIRGFIGAGEAVRRHLALTLCLGVALTASMAHAQSQYSPAIRVDGAVITQYELNQRMAFLSALGAPGDVRALAADQLIGEVIQMREAKKADVTVDSAAVETAMTEFAARGNLSTDQFLQYISQKGVAAETFRDFVTAGITWRDFVRKTFLPEVTVGRSEVQQAMAESVTPKGLRVLLSEIVLPAGDAASRKASMARAKRLLGLDEAEFTDAASRFSTATSRNMGGAMDWIDVAALPPNVTAAVRGLKPGQTSRVIAGNGEIRIYFMRDREQVSGATPRKMVEYAALLLPGGQSSGNVAEAQSIRKRALQCDDLYPIARGLKPEQLVREELPESQLPATYAAELAQLDPGEMSWNVTTSGGAMAVLMVCARGNELPRSVTETMIGNNIRASRVGTMAQAFLEKQRANARVEYLN